MCVKCFLKVATATSGGVSALVSLPEWATDAESPSPVLIFHCFFWHPGHKKKAGAKANLQKKKLLTVIMCSY